MEVTGLKRLGHCQGNCGFKTFGGVVGAATGLKRLGASPNRVLSFILLRGSWACSRFMFLSRTVLCFCGGACTASLFFGFGASRGVYHHHFALHAPAHCNPHQLRAPQWALILGNRHFSSWGSDAKHSNALLQAPGFAARAPGARALAALQSLLAICRRPGNHLVFALDKYYRLSIL
jgi:hypothetical protein